jgi:hypothetical protein
MRGRKKTTRSPFSRRSRRAKARESRALSRPGGFANDRDRTPKLFREAAIAARSTPNRAIARSRLGLKTSLKYDARVALKFPSPITFSERRRTEA